MSAISIRRLGGVNVCVLYQDLISTYQKSCVQNFMISAQSEHPKPLDSGLWCISDQI